MMGKRWMLMILLATICLSLLGCSAAQKQKIDEADRWIRENMW